MGDVLSQSQIDELLNSFSNEGTKAFDDLEENSNEKKYKLYDFKMPKKFTKEQFKIIDDIYEMYSRLLSSYLTSLTRLFCKVKVLQIEEQKYYEFNNALPDYTMLGTIDLGIDDNDIVDAKCIMQISNTITFALIDRLLGGSGTSFDLSRDFTEIEVLLIKNVMFKMAEILKDAWLDYMDIQPRLVSMETNSRVSQSIGPDEIIVLITLEVQFNDVKNVITISIPAVNMESIMSKFSGRYARNARLNDVQREKERRVKILNGIKDTTLKVDAVLAETKLDLNDILKLEVNDIIPLNAPVSKNVKIKIKDNLWFDGKLGVSNNKKAIKVDNIYKS